jgi:hypothetical protein
MSLPIFSYPHVTTHFTNTFFITSKSSSIFKFLTQEESSASPHRMRDPLHNRPHLWLRTQPTLRYINPLGPQFMQFGPSLLYLFTVRVYVVRGYNIGGGLQYAPLQYSNLTHYYYKQIDFGDTIF